MTNPDFALLAIVVLLAIGIAMLWRAAEQIPKLPKDLRRAIRTEREWRRLFRKSR